MFPSRSLSNDQIMVHLVFFRLHPLLPVIVILKQIPDITSFVINISVWISKDKDSFLNTKAQYHYYALKIEWYIIHVKSGSHFH